MGFGIWVEPEMVNPDSELYRAIPTWVYHFANRSRTQRRNQLVLNLARDDVAEWVYQTIDRLLTEHDIDFLKWDMNRHLSEPGWPEQAGSNPERVWIAHTTNLYAILDRLTMPTPPSRSSPARAAVGRVTLASFHGAPRCGPRITRMPGTASPSKRASRSLMPPWR